jgi:hypothetical protein
MRKYKKHQIVTLCFHTQEYGFVQHTMIAEQALRLASDLKAAKPDMTVWPVDEYGRRITNEPITFADLEI